MQFPALDRTATVLFSNVDTIGGTLVTMLTNRPRPQRSLELQAEVRSELSTFCSSLQCNHVPFLVSASVSQSSHHHSTKEYSKIFFLIASSHP